MAWSLYVSGRHRVRRCLLVSARLDGENPSCPPASAPLNAWRVKEKIDQAGVIVKYGGKIVSACGARSNRFLFRNLSLFDAFQSVDESFYRTRTTWSASGSSHRQYALAVRFRQQRKQLGHRISERLGGDVSDSKGSAAYPPRTFWDYSKPRRLWMPASVSGYRAARRNLNLPGNSLNGRPVKRPLFG